MGSQVKKKKWENSLNVIENELDSKEYELKLLHLKGNGQNTERIYIKKILFKLNYKLLEQRTAEENIKFKFNGKMIRWNIYKKEKKENLKRKDQEIH